MYREALRPTETGLKHFFLLELQEIYEVEKTLCQFLAQIQIESTTDEVRQLLLQHAVETQLHVRRLEKVFSILDIKASNKKSQALEGILKGVDRAIEETEVGTSTRDSALIIAIQKIEHYEIASYGGLVQLATSLGYEEVTLLLQKTLQDEKDIDLLLSDLAEKRVNWLAETEEKNIR